MKYTPDKWVILKLFYAEKGDAPIFKVLGSWAGSYLSGQAWRLNSGINGARKTKNGYDILGYSGSTYACRAGGYGTTAYVGGILATWIEENHPGIIEPLSEKEAIKYLKGLSSGTKKAKTSRSKS